MRVLVCGGRDYTEKKHLFFVLDAMHAQQRITLIVHGASGKKDLHGNATCGADLFAEEWARSEHVPFRAYPVSDAEWKTYGKFAGPRRNMQMLQENAPELVVAFAGGRGTASMTKIAEGAGVQVVRVKPLGSH